MEHIGRYEILEELGRGAMGAVYKARDPQIGRIVAIKVILTANLSKEDLEHYKERFYREAQTAGQMTHVGIVTIHDIAEDEKGQPFLVMEYVHGTPLHRLLAPPRTAQPGAVKLAEGGLSVEQKLDIGIQVAEALEYAHRRCVIHRDIKPSNILIAEEETAGDAEGPAARRLRAKIVDFGIAKLAGTSQTQTGYIMGTPAFMSPEQVSMSGVDSRSDIFSLGGVLYWMFTGEKPFPGESLTQVTFKVVFGAPLPAKYLRPELPEDLDVVLSRCLAKNPEDRYPTARDLANDLELVKTGKPLHTTPAPPADMTVLEPNPLPMVAAGLPPGQRPSQSPLPLFADPTTRVGSRTGESTPPGAQAAPVAVPETQELPSSKAPATTSIRLAGLLTLLLIALLAAAYQFWPRAYTQPAARPAAQAQSPTEEQPAPADLSASAQATAPSPPPELAKTETAPVAQPVESKPAATKAAKKKSSVPLAKSTLQVECRNNFDEATLAISVDGKPLFKEVMRDKKPLHLSRAIPPGLHMITVHVISTRPDFDQKQEIGTRFEAGTAHPLVIEFGKGTGLGLRGRKLTVRWGTPRKSD